MKALEHKHKLGDHITDLQFKSLIYDNKQPNTTIPGPCWEVIIEISVVMKQNYTIVGITHDELCWIVSLMEMINVRGRHQVC